MKTYSKIASTITIGTVCSALALLQYEPASAGDSIDDVYDAPVTLDLKFVYHVDQEMAEQDVFIQRERGSARVYRPTKADRDMNAPLYRAANPVEHAPFEPEKVGPYRKGEPLATLR